MMDSINQQQPEKNHEDLAGTKAAEKMKELAEKAAACFFCTKITSRQPIAVRPMSAQKVEEDGTFWFLSSVDSNKNAEIAVDAHVQLLFQGSAHSDFLSIYGHASISTDKAKIKELWQPILKAWFTDGEDDQRITVIKVDAKEGYYWDNKHGSAIAFVKTIAGAVMGKTLDDSIEGKLSV